MSDLKYIVILFSLVTTQCLLLSDHFRAESYQEQTIAAIKDNGCNTHIDIPAPKNETNATNYNMKGFE